jgi:hypothetical protein
VRAINAIAHQYTDRSFRQWTAVYLGHVPKPEVLFIGDKRELARVWVTAKSDDSLHMSDWALRHGLTPLQLKQKGS